MMLHDNLLSKVEGHSLFKQTLRQTKIEDTGLTCKWEWVVELTNDSVLRADFITTPTGSYFIEYSMFFLPEEIKNYVVLDGFEEFDLLNVHSTAFSNKIIPIEFLTANSDLSEITFSGYRLKEELTLRTIRFSEKFSGVKGLLEDKGDVI